MTIFDLYILIIIGIIILAIHEYFSENKTDRRKR